MSTFKSKIACSHIDITMNFCPLCNPDNTSKGQNVTMNFTIYYNGLSKSDHIIADYACYRQNATTGYHIIKNFSLDGEMFTTHIDISIHQTENVEITTTTKQISIEGVYLTDSNCFTPTVFCCSERECEGKDNC